MAAELMKRAQHTTHGKARKEVETCGALGPLGLPDLLESWRRGALPPLGLRAVCLVRAMVFFYASKKKTVTTRPRILGLDTDLHLHLHVHVRTQSKQQARKVPRLVEDKTGTQHPLYPFVFPPKARWGRPRTQHTRERLRKVAEDVHDG